MKLYHLIMLIREIDVYHAIPLMAGLRVLILVGLVSGLETNALFTILLNLASCLTAFFVKEYFIYPCNSNSS